MVNYPGREEPLTICMWDFSWLQCGHAGGAFEDLELRVSQAAERGYNTLRVDVFPNHYLAGEVEFAQTPPRRVRTWGDVTVPGGFTVDVRSKVRELASLCRKYGLHLGLDTWQSGAIVPDARVPVGQEEAAAGAIAAAWCRSIPAMRDDGVLERAVWLAPLNEVPLFLGMKLEAVRVSDPEQRHEGMTAFRADLPELDDIFHNVNRRLGESVKEAIEADGIPLSYSALGAENYGARVPEFYDVVDVHFMPDLILQPEDVSALEQAGAGASKFSLHRKLDTYDLAVYSEAWNAACRRNYAAMLALCHDYARNATQRLVTRDGKRLWGVVTEAFGPCNFPDVPEVDWSGYYRYNADAARIFSQYDFAGLTVSNHAEPIFRMWDEVDLQASTNHYVLAATASAGAHR
jgi:hypothetical protein